MPQITSFGVIPWLSALVAHIKTHKNYTDAIGQDLRLVGMTHVIDPSSWWPSLSIQSTAGHSIIAWKKGKASAIEFWVDRCDGNQFVFLTINTRPNTPTLRRFPRQKAAHYGNTKPFTAYTINKSENGVM